MKHFFALPAILRISTILAFASQQSFSVTDDLLAFPQYKIRLGEKWISVEEAQARLLSTPGESSLQDEDQDQDAVGKYHGTHTAQTDSDHESESSKDVPIEYEYMVLNGQRWLCSVPLITKREEADSANETLSRAEEERELARATDRGWELLDAMKDTCVYFVSGWWSYSFCYNEGVKQFHQLPSGRGVPSYPPKEDPHEREFILGTYDKRAVDDDDGPPKEEWTGESALSQSERARRKRSGPGELVQHGESRYLVQHLSGGTVCDLTGKARNIEVQFHCNPSSTDKISLIKETTTCAYLMVIQTPRLCRDDAFQPPQKDRPNPITCSPILTENEIEGYEKKVAAAKASEHGANILKAQAAAATALGGPAMESARPRVGDIYVGGHSMIPKDKKIEKSAILGGGKETLLDTVASSDGKSLSKQELEKRGLGDAKSIETLSKEVERIAKGQPWKLNVVETAQGREFRAIIGDDDDEDEPEQREGKTSKEAKKNREAKKDDGKKDGKKSQKSGKKPGGEKGHPKEEL